MTTREYVSSHPLAEIYVARALDPIIELARAVSRDFVKRPQHYTHVSADETALLKNFRLLAGKHPEWPDAAQRSFASTKLLARLSQSFTAVRLSAIQYVQRVSAPGGPIARRSFIESATLLRATVQPLEGAALSAVADTHSAMLERAVAVVGSERVSATFGLAEISTGDGLRSMFSPRFGYLCESMSQTLVLDRPLPQATISSLQRAAQYGSATIVGVLDPSFSDADEDHFSEVVQSATTWAAALGELLSRIDIARAWKDPAYRARLHSLEKDIMPPHPSGEINLEGTIRTESARFPSGAFGFMTQTVAGEICCSTGDLICEVTNTNGQCDLSDDCPTLTSMPV